MASYSKLQQLDIENVLHRLEPQKDNQQRDESDLIPTAKAPFPECAGPRAE
jgi:hypothetical protein